MTDANEQKDDVWTAVTWRVRSADGEGEVGPVSLDQVRRGLEAGKIEPTVRLARVGSDTWLAARDIINAAITRDKALSAKPPEEPERETIPQVSKVQVSDPDRTHPGARMPAAPSSGLSTSSLILLVVLSMGVVAALSFVVFRNLGHRPDVSEKGKALDFERLPRWTIAVNRSRIRGDIEELGEVPPAYVASWLAARACGGTDVASRLHQARGKSLSVMHDLGVVGLAGQTAWIQALQCGEQLAKALTDPSQTTISFEHDQTLHTVTMVALGVERMPDSPSRVAHTYARMDGFCTPAKDGSCDPIGPAGFRSEGAWCFGTHAAIDAFASSYTSAHRELSSNVDILVALAAHARQADEQTWLVRPRSIPWLALCERAAPSHDAEAFVRACYPTSSKSAMESAETKTRGLIIEHDRLTGRSIRWSLVLLTRGDDAARWVEADLRDIERDWTSHLADNEPKLIAMLRDASANPHDRLWSRALEPFVRALHDVRIERRGVAVRLDVRTDLTPHETKSIGEILHAKHTEHEAVVGAIEALSSGRRIAAAALVPLLGSDVAEWASTPRATEAQCRELAKKYESLAADPSALELVDIRERLSKAFEPSACTGMVLTDAYRSCLITAASLHAFAACEPPRSPYAAEAHRRLRGQWSVTSIDTRRAESWSYSMQSAVRQCRIEIGELRVAVDCLNQRAMEPVRIHAHDLAAATVWLPIAQRVEARRIELGEDPDRWTMTDFVRGVSVTFRRDNFESLITAR